MCEATGTEEDGTEIAADVSPESFRAAYQPGH